MRPPLCRKCGRTLADAPMRDFVLVGRKVEEPYPDHHTGHPKGAYWMCRTCLAANDMRRQDRMMMTLLLLLCCSVTTVRTV